MNEALNASSKSRARIRQPMARLNIGKEEKLTKAHVKDDVKRRFHDMFVSMYVRFLDGFEAT